MIFYIKNPDDSIKKTAKLLELINEFSKLAGYKINKQKPIVCLYTNNEPAEREIMKSIPFITASKRIEYLGIILTKEDKDLYTENYKKSKKLKKVQINEKIFCAHRLEKYC